MKKVYTVGHSDRSLSEFIELLKAFNIAVVIDVRRWPRSRVVRWFHREVLEVVLKGIGTGYVWLGEELGGYRPGGYESYMRSDEFRRGFQKLIEIIEGTEGGYPAIMCRERLWFKCHRRFLANKLVELGYEVIHIVDRNRVEEHRLRSRY